AHEEIGVVRLFPATLRSVLGIVEAEADDLARLRDHRQELRFIQRTSRCSAKCILRCNKGGLSCPEETRKVAGQSGDGRQVCDLPTHEATQPGSSLLLECHKTHPVPPASATAPRLPPSIVHFACRSRT